MNNILGLQIPDIEHVVFRAADYPFAASHREIGKYTVLLIAMARIRFQALNRNKIQQLINVELEGTLYVQPLLV